MNDKVERSTGSDMSEEEDIARTLITLDRMDELPISRIESYLRERTQRIIKNRERQP